MPTLLILETNAAVQDAISATLQEAGYRFVLCPTVEHIREALATASDACVILLSASSHAARDAFLAFFLRNPLMRERHTLVIYTQDGGRIPAELQHHFHTVMPLHLETLPTFLRTTFPTLAVQQPIGALP